MKKNQMSTKIRLLAGITAAVIGMTQPVSTVLANPHYDRRMTVAEEEMVPAAGATDTLQSRAAVNKKAWQKINGICYNGSGVKIPGAITRGMDVSQWQEKINWAQVKKSGIDFAFVRIAYGSAYLDKTYDYNMEQAELAGVPVGTYIYSTATTTAGALKEAQLAIRKMQGYKVSYPVVFDLEYEKAQSLSPKRISQMALTFCNEVRKAGYYPMIYCNTYWYNNFIDWSLLSGIDVWIARYGDTIQAPDASLYSYTIWQSTDGNRQSGLNTTSGLISGIPAGNDVDLNFGYVDYTKKITPRWKAKSDYVAASKPDTSSGSTGRKNGWQETGDKIYYYTNGKRAAGWKTIEGKTYYFDPKSGLMQKDQLIIEDEKIYYVDKDGARAADTWKEYEGKTYYFTTDGTAAKALKRINGRYYWFHVKSGYLYKNRKIVRQNGDTYYAGSNGACYTNGMRKVREDGVIHTYYFQKNGKAYKGWLTYEGKKYYFYKGNSKLSGTRAENVTLTSAKKVVSVFNEEGVCIRQYTN